MNKNYNPAWGCTLCALRKRMLPCFLKAGAIFLIICISGKAEVSAQITFTANRLLKSYNSTAEYMNSQIYDNGLNVGISTDIPVEKLDVAGNIRTSGTFVSAVADGISPMIVNSTTLVSNLNCDWLNGHHASDFSLTSHRHLNMASGSGVTSQVAFWASDSVLTSENALFWDYSTNRLGIGIDAPEADLHLYNGSDQTSIFISETHAGLLGGSLIDSKWSISNHAGVLKFNVFNGIQQVNIMKLAGSNASGTMEVNGNLKTTRFCMTQGAAVGYVLSSTATGTAVWKDPLLATGWSVSGGNVYKMSGYVGIGTQQMQARCNIQTSTIPGLIVNVTQSNDAWGYGIIAKVESPNVAAFSVEQSGVPTLMVWGDGRIHATKVRVKVPVFPDFVFEQEYDLPAIPEVEKFIQQNGRLPGIPAAQEVVQNGLDLGEINGTLVQKVEELTLYVIQLYNENIELRARMVAVEKQP